MPDRQAEMRLMLRGLRLPAIAAVYEDLAIKAAKANLTHEDFLYELLRPECLQRDEHRVARLQRLSGLPPDKTFRTLQLEAEKRFTRNACSDCQVCLGETSSAGRQTSRATN